MKSLPSNSTAASDAPAQDGAEKRNRPDRRQEPTSPWAALPPAGQRVQNRRTNEHRQPYFVDRFSAATLFIVLLLVAASLIDAILTVQLIRAGGVEANPLMAYLLDHGILPFILGKYLLTVGGLPLLLIFKNHYLFGTPIRVGYLVPAAAVLYAILIGYQLTLMQKYVI